VNALDSLLCNISELYPQWARALLVMSPYSGARTELTPTGLSIAPVLPHNKHDVRDILSPVIHGILEHSKDRETLKRSPNTTVQERAFDAIAFSLATLIMERSDRRIPWTSDVFPDVREAMRERVSEAKTVRGLAGAALDTLGKTPKSKISSLASEAEFLSIPELTCGSVLTGTPHDPEFAPRAGPEPAPIPGILLEDSPAGLEPLFDAYRALMSPSAGKHLPAMNDILAAAADCIERANEAPNAAAWAVLIVEAAFSRAFALARETSFSLGMITDCPAFDSYQPRRQRYQLQGEI